MDVLLKEAAIGFRAALVHEQDSFHDRASSLAHAEGAMDHDAALE